MRAYTALMRDLWRRILPLALGLSFSFVCAGQAQEVASTAQVGQNPLARQYREGELISYAMTGANRGHLITTRYTARATGAVQKDASGTFVEKFAWSDLVVDGKAVPLPLI